MLRNGATHTGATGGLVSVLVSRPQRHASLAVLDYGPSCEKMLPTVIEC